MTTLEALAHLKQARRIWPGCELGLRAIGESWCGTVTLGNEYGGNDLLPVVTYSHLMQLSELLGTSLIVVTGSGEWSPDTDDMTITVLVIEAIW